MKKIVIIGNGISAIKNENGNFINNCDVVVRINNFKINGYEKYVGTKFNFYACQLKYFNYLKLSKKEKYDKWKKITSNDRKILKQIHKNIINFDEEYDRVFSPPNIDVEKLDKLLCLWTENKEDLCFGNIFFENKIYTINFIMNPSYSMGFKSILYCLNNYKNHTIYVTGFDNYMNSGWYWDDNNLTNNIIRTDKDGHPYLEEKILMLKFKNKKQIIEI